jgi:O-methyltransferase
MAQTRAKIAGHLFPCYSSFIDKLNRNALVAKWIRENNRNKLPTFTERRALHSYINEHVCGDGPIDYLEFGVYRGETIYNWSQMNRNPDSRFIGFDSFTGLPESWTSRHGAGAFDLGGALPSIKDQRVSFVQGWFQDTLRQALERINPRSRLIIHNDSDLYSSTLFVLATLDPWIVPGSVVIFDEFCVALHEFRAFADYTAAFNRNPSPIAMTADFATQAAFLF